MKKFIKIWKRLRFAGFTLFILSLMAAGAMAQGPIIIDHNCTDLTRIPPYWRDAAKNVRVHYGHTSHGGQLTEGLDALEGIDPNYSVAVRVSDGSAGLPPVETPPALRIYDGNPPGTYIEPQDYWESEDGLSRTRAVVNTGDYDVSMWAWCGQLSWWESWQVQDYLDTMNTLDTQYPDIPFVYFTGHLASGDPTLKQNNDQIRSYVSENNKVLYDFADIELYDPAGVLYANGGDGCDWCPDWCANNPADCAGLLLGEECYHTHPFNCLNKAKAFWWMMARISGWDSECAAYFPDTGTVHIPYLEVDGQFYWVNFNVTEQGLVLDTQ
ncbi:MAG: hypothetical protein GY859_23335, partial [Desulfobacterales bacterium]|nr:hypothetical protein [Desulfobacterales bacterium]